MVRSVARKLPTLVRGDRLSNTTCLTHVFFKNDEERSKFN